MSVSITKPASGETLTGLALVEATYDGKNFDIATVTVDGVQLASDSAQPISFSIDSARVADGAHTLTVAVRYRTSGGALRWQKSSIPITTKGNDMQVDLSTSGGTNLTGTVTVTAVVTPSAQAETPVRCDFSVDGGPILSTDTSYPLTFSWNTTTIADGNHILRAKVVAGTKTRTATGALAVSVKNTVTPPPPPPTQGAPVNTVAPVVSGTATEGQTLSMSTGSWTNSPNRQEYQWTRCDAAGANCVSIPSAVGTTYTLTAADVGKTIRCWTTVWNSYGPSAPYLSAQTAVVSALTPAVPVLVTTPVISGTAAVGNTLSISNGGWTNAPTSYTHQWLLCDTTGEACSSPSGETNTTYVVPAAAVGKTIRCWTTAINATGDSTPVRSAATAVVPGSPPPPSGQTLTAPANLATAQANAAAGTVFTLAAGNFGNQTFTLNKTVKFIGAPGAVVGDVTFSPGAGGVEFASQSLSSMMKIGTVSFGSSSSASKVVNCTLRDLDGMRFWIEHAQHIDIIGGDWGPVPSGTWGPRVATSSTDPNRIPVDILIDGGWYHDMVNDPGAEHLEGILVYAGNGITIRNCRFNRLGQTGDLGINFLHISGTTPVCCNWLIEGNQGSPVSEGYPPYAYYNVQTDKPLIDRQNVVFRNNIFPRPGTGQWAGPNGTYLTGDGLNGNATMLAPPAGWPR